VSERLAYHREKSGPVMVELKQWMEARLGLSGADHSEEIGCAAESGVLFDVE
jgi:hypothetical protein